MPSLRRHSRLRLALFWSLFALAAAGTAAAVWILQATVRSGLDEEQRRVLARETERAVAHTAAYVDEVRRSTVSELAGFHADGLGRALRRWDEANAVVVGTFEWDSARGFAAASVLTAAGESAAALPKLWAGFDEWRAAHAAASSCDLAVVGEWRVGHLRTRDNPLLPVEAMRYQAENLDVLAYAGRPVDPWAGWAAREDDPSAPWVFWYRPGPDAPVRGCLVDVAPLLADLTADFSEVRIVAIWLGGGAKPESGVMTVDLPAFPGTKLVVKPGAILTERHARTRLSLIIVGMLCALFVVAAGWLAVYSRREARDAERKTTFVSQVSHELRTPLTSIRMFADMLGAPNLPEEKRQKFAGTISRESQRLAGLIERLLAFNALEKGKPAVAVAPVDVAALVAETLDEIEGALTECGMRLERALPPNAVQVATDRDAVKQALINLLDNAAKYARDGSLVRVALELDTSRVIVSVSDRGPGIPPAHRTRVFEPFVQGGGRALTDKSPGLGLGLSIARGLLRRAGGDLVLARAATGATFEIHLPFTPKP
jgi:signal transduction histidine kinase